MNKKLDANPKSPSAKPKAEAHKSAPERTKCAIAHTLQGYEQALKLLQTQKYEKARRC